MFACHAMRSFCNKARALLVGRCKCPPAHARRPQDKTALKGLAHYFKLEMERFTGCALLWSDYQTKRGGDTLLLPISQPEHDFSAAEGDALHVLQVKLALERMKYDKLNAMHKIAEDAKDKHFEDLIEDKMGAHLLVIKQNADWVNQLRGPRPRVRACVASCAI